MALAFLAIILGLVLLVWSADRFVDGAVGTAHHFKMPPLLIGMVIVGFGTSAPEMVVSALAASQGNPGIALGNAYGSNIANIALILGITAIISPIVIHSQVLRKELPLLVAITALAAWQLINNEITRYEAAFLLGVFIILMFWTIKTALKQQKDPLSTEFSQELETKSNSIRLSLIWMIVGLLLLLISSRILVWGAVSLAQSFGVSDLIIGLTIVAVGTSLPELASSIIAARKGEDDIALGNILGSNLFNSLAVVGIAGVIHPMTVGSEVLYRDVFVMSLLTLSLFIFGIGSTKPGRINRGGGLALLLSYICYTGFLIFSTVNI